MDRKRKLIILAIFSAMIITLGIVGYHYWYNTTYYVSTEDAQVAGDLIQVTPKISGNLLEFNVQEGSSVEKNEIMGRVDPTGIDDSKIDTSLIRAPISGLIVRKQAAVGEFYDAGTELAVMIDPSQIYINANIEETKIQKIQIGQIVDISIDQFSRKKFEGTVEFVGKASNSAFSLLPSSSDGSFTKVVQKVPVKIKFKKIDVNLLPGTNATVAIHIK
ncbi:HlyD family secretion protein [Clostridium sp. WILCCON 0269]|uniref:HlyD family secretion protein n=1 Tax=Candidatus Clostridium eludens TaxID=3381663 RepID=A0ABW8SJR6_9CLOT